jgi:hypothetical protein
VRKVFVSYSRDDSAFADRLVADLRMSSVPATYDKWLLNVGDSIIGRLSAEVTSADRVIVLMSPASVQSNWVAKELALAMMGEINSASVKVLPAVIADCVVPDMLADKLYADFRHEYFRGLRSLLRALLPGEQYDRMSVRLRRPEEAQAARAQLAGLLQDGDGNATRDWVRSHPFALAGLFDHLWHAFDFIPGPRLGAGSADFAVVNGQSGRYDVTLLGLGDVDWQGTTHADGEVARLSEALHWSRSNLDLLRRSLAVSLSDSYGAEQLFPGTDEATAMGTEVNLDAKLLLGRRSDYDAPGNAWRNRWYEGSGRDVDIISYDRVLDVLGRMRWG